MKCLCGYEGEDFTRLPLLEVCVPDHLSTDEEIKKHKQLEKEMGTELPQGELKRSFACPKCGTLKIEVQAPPPWPARHNRKLD